MFAHAPSNVRVVARCLAAVSWAYLRSIRVAHVTSRDDDGCGAPVVVVQEWRRSGSRAFSGAGDGTTGSSSTRRHAARVERQQHGLAQRPRRTLHSERRHGQRSRRTYTTTRQPTTHKTQHHNTTQSTRNNNNSTQHAKIQQSEDKRGRESGRESAYGCTCVEWCGVVRVLLVPFLLHVELLVRFVFVFVFVVVCFALCAYHCCWQPSSSSSSSSKHVNRFARERLVACDYCAALRCMLWRAVCVCVLVHVSMRVAVLRISNYARTGTGNTATQHMYTDITTHTRTLKDTCTCPSVPPRVHGDVVALCSPVVVLCCACRCAATAAVQTCSVVHV